MTDPSKQPQPIPLSRGNAAEQIIGDLRDQIQGRYPKGSKLPSERELAAWYKVSVPTVREAIRGLSAVHLVEARHGTGIYVTAAADMMFAMAASTLIELERVRLLDILDIMEALLSKAAILACENGTDGELNRIVTVLDALDNAQTNEDLAAHLSAFLKSIAQASHNALISTLVNFLSDLQMEVIQDKQIGLGDRWKDIAAQIGPRRHLFADALRSRDVARATALTADYHAHTKQLVTAGLATRPRDADAAMRRAVKRVQAR